MFNWFKKKNKNENVIVKDNINYIKQSQLYLQQMIFFNKDIVNYLNDYPKFKFFITIDQQQEIPSFHIISDYPKKHNIFNYDYSKISNAIYNKHIKVSDISSINYWKHPDCYLLKINMIDNNIYIIPYINFFNFAIAIIMLSDIKQRFEISNLNKNSKEDHIDILTYFKLSTANSWIITTDSRLMDMFNNYKPNKVKEELYKTEVLSDVYKFESIVDNIQIYKCELFKIKVPDNYYVIRKNNIFNIYKKETNELLCYEYSIDDIHYKNTMTIRHIPYVKDGNLSIPFDNLVWDETIYDPEHLECITE